MDRHTSFSARRDYRFDDACMRRRIARTNKLSMTTNVVTIEFMNQSHQTIQEIRHHTRKLMRELDVVKGIFLDTGFTYTQCHLMFELSQHTSLNLLQLADNLLLDKSNTSRTVKRLVELGMVHSAHSQEDRRQRDLSLTAKGRRLITRVNILADTQVSEALNLLNPNQRRKVVEGLGLYADALQRIRLQADYSIRRIQRKDNADIAQIIRDVMTEFDAVGKGYSIVDEEVNDMFGNYRNAKRRYYVLLHQERVVGGAGIAPLRGGASSICELRKMFFLPRHRGIGMGRRLLAHVLDQARRLGYQKCYIETLDRMERATRLYKNAGFETLNKPLGNTGHGACDRWYVLNL